MSGAGRRILLVEDELFTASLIQQSLEAHGFDVRTAANAAEALTEVDAFDPDAALIDISLGDGPSGIDLAHILHKDSPWVALLILTKHPDPRTAGVTKDDLPPGCGFLRKELVRSADHLLESIEAVFTAQTEDVRHDTGLLRDAEDALDRAELTIAREEDDYVPWEQVKAELGLT